MSGVTRITCHWQKFSSNAERDQFFSILLGVLFYSFSDLGILDILESLPDSLRTLSVAQLEARSKATSIRTDPCRGAWACTIVGSIDAPGTRPVNQPANESVNRSAAAYQTSGTTSSSRFSQNRQGFASPQCSRQQDTDFPSDTRSRMVPRSAMRFITKRSW